MTGRIAQDHSGAQESDPRQDSLHDPPDGVLIGGNQRAVGRLEHDNRGHGRAEANQGMSPHARWFPVQLAIQPKQSSEKERGAETQSRFFISAEDHEKD